MREITIWEAEDGTLFKDESDCLGYEWKQDVESKGHKYALLDSNYALLDNSKPGSYYDCWFIYLKDRDSAKVLRNIWNDDIMGCYCPDFINDYANTDPGLWAFNSDNDEWYHVGERIANLQDMADECMKVINGG